MSQITKTGNSQGSSIVSRSDGVMQNSAVTESQSIVANKVNDTPEVSNSHANENTSSPVLSAPGKTDYQEALSFSALYTELIVLMCETNRNNYEANRAVADMQMEMRVGQLEAAAKKTMGAAITGLVAGVLSGTVGIAGGLYAGGRAGITMRDSNRMNAANTGWEFPDANQPAHTNTKFEKFLGGIDGTPTREQIDFANTKNQIITTLSTMVLPQSMSSIGQGISGALSSASETLKAEAESTEASRQISTGNAQQYQQMMSKFNEILASFLEAELKSASAAAQA